MHNSLLSVLANGLLLASPLLLAAMGGLLSERSGVVNIALEGKMLIAACVAFLVSVATGSALIGLLAALLVAIFWSLVHLVATQVYRIDAVVSGMALNALALGGSNFLVQRYEDPSRAAGFPSVPIAAYETFALVIPVVVLVFLAHTRLGLRLQAVGSDPDKASLVGVRPLAIRLYAQIGTGLLCGVAGAMIATNAGGFTNAMTAGRGFIALAALVLGGWRPIPAMLACLAFGFLEALQISLQGTNLFGLAIPSELWSSLPYLATVVALAGLMGRKQAPAGLGKL